MEKEANIDSSVQIQDKLAATRDLKNKIFAWFGSEEFKYSVIYRLFSPVKLYAYVGKSCLVQEVLPFGKYKIGADEDCDLLLPLNSQSDTVFEISNDIPFLGSGVTVNDVSTKPDGSMELTVPGQFDPVTEFPRNYHFGTVTLRLKRNSVFQFLVYAIMAVLLVVSVLILDRVPLPWGNVFQLESHQSQQSENLRMAPSYQSRNPVLGQVEELLNRAENVAISGQIGRAHV